MSVTYRPARPEDAAALLLLLRRLAEYENMTDEFHVTQDQVDSLFFGDFPHAFCLLAEHDGQAAGFCLYYFGMASFAGRPVLYIHDLFVSEDHRGKRIGQGFFAELVKLAKDQNACRIEWTVLDWNKPAREFYERIGAHHLEKWLPYRLDEAAMNNLLEAETR